MTSQLYFAAVYASFSLGVLVNVTRAEDTDATSYPVLAGVGIALAEKDGSLFASKIIPESPAAELGLIKKGSRLVSVTIDGETVSLTGKTVGEAASLIRGPVGTKLDLVLIAPDGSTGTKVTLVRKPLEIGGHASSSYKALIGKPIANLQLTSLEDSTKKRLSDYRGKVVVLDVWASWCRTCYAPVAKLQKMLEGNPHWVGKVELVTLSIDSEISDAVKVVKQQKWDRTQNQLVDANDLNAMGVTVVPVIIIVAPDGTIATMAGAHAIDVEKEVGALLAK